MTPFSVGGWGAALAVLLAADGGARPDANLAAKTGDCDIFAAKRADKLDVPVLEAFAARGCNFDVVDSVGQTLLNSSIADGEYKLVRWLLAHGVRADRRNRTADETALHWLAFDQQHMEAD